MAACECSLLILSSISSKVSVLNCCSSMSSPRNWSRIIYKIWHERGRGGGREGGSRGEEEGGKGEREEGEGEGRESKGKGMEGVEREYDFK